MKHFCSVWMRIIGFAILCASMPATAQVEISVTLTGPVSEILPILELLNDLGVGEIRVEGNTPDLKLHSSYPDSDKPENPEAEAKPEMPEQAPEAVPAPEAAPDPEPAPAPTGPSFSDFQATPASAEVGQQVMISVKLDDPTGKVDTVAFTIGELEGVAGDLYDNGANGDEAAGDGVWTLVTPVPEVDPQTYTLNLVAFDKFATPVKIETKDGPVPLQARTTVQVVD